MSTPLPACCRSRRRGADRLLPVDLARTLRSAHLRSAGVTSISGCGAVTDMTVVIAMNDNARGAPST